MKQQDQKEWFSVLDSRISLAQELNLPSGTEGLSERAEAGTLTSGNARVRERGTEPEEDLARAVVQQAAEDWRRAEAFLYRHPEHRKARARKRETERFFRSRWFQMLTDLDGEAFLERLRAERGAEPSGRSAEKAGVPGRKRINIPK